VRRNGILAVSEAAGLVWIMSQILFRLSLFYKETEEHPMAQRDTGRASGLPADN